MIHEIIRRMINVMVVDLIDTSRKNIEQAEPETVDDIRQHHEQLMSFSKNMTAQKLELKQFLRSRLYQHYQVHRMSKKAGAIIKALFDAFMDDTRILHPEARESCLELEKAKGDAGLARGVSDYIAGMTDRYAIVEYERIFNPRQLSFASLTP